MRSERRRTSRRTAALALAIVLTSAGLSAAAEATAVAPEQPGFDLLLRKYVTENGVRYAAWHRDPADRLALKRCVAHMEETDIPHVESSPEGAPVALAFWINLHNAAVLDLVLDGFPVPSVRDLGGADGSAWQGRAVTVAGRPLSLDAIEHEILPAFREPRVPFALTLAARGCPPLRAGAYLPDSLDAQLDEQVRSFVRGGGAELAAGSPPTLRLSKIFDWHREDFEAAAGSVAAWLRPYWPDLAAIPESAEVVIDFSDCDWSLNQAREP